jgi:Mrp family chromosome partitioning ATPase
MLPTTFGARKNSPIDTLEIFPAAVLANLRRTLTLLMYQQSLPRRIGVVSALRREGVTYITLALSAILASDKGARVCAVDLNWEAPALLEQCEGGFDYPAAGQAASSNGVPGSGPLLPRRLGIAEVLTGTIALQQVLVPTVLPTLQVLGMGAMIEQERALIARSQALHDLIDELDARYDYVLLDLPALLYTSDAIALASLSEACCLVVRQGVTPLSMVKRALDELKHKQMLGVILNRAQVHTPQLLLNFVPQE